MFNIKDKISFNRLLLVVILLAGIILRGKAYFEGYTLWLDECSLSLSIIKRGLFGFFSPLEHTQSAPPLFMMLTKFITSIFGINEFSLRFIPFISSLASLPVFYLFSKKFLIKKYSVAVAFLLFCINYWLIYYCVEFKQYSSDVLTAMLAFLVFEHIKIKDFSYKKLFLTGFGAFILFLFCVPSIFVTGGFVVCNFKNNIKKLLAFLSPFIAFMPFYYIFSLYPARLQMMNMYKDLWQGGFVTLNPLSFILILKDSLQYFFGQDNFILFGVILFIAGLYAVLKQIKTPAPLLLAGVLICAIVASFFEIYPIKQRVALYLLPFFLVLTVKPLDFIDFKARALKSSVIILLFIFFTGSYQNIYKNIENKKGYGNKLMSVMGREYKNDEIIVINDASYPIYEYNSMRQGFKSNNFIVIKTVKYTKEYYINTLNALPKGYTYWFYYPNQYAAKPVVPFIEEWAKDKNILDTHKTGSAYLLRVKL